MDPLGFLVLTLGILMIIIGVKGTQKGIKAAILGHS